MSYCFTVILTLGYTVIMSLGHTVNMSLMTHGRCEHMVADLLLAARTALTPVTGSLVSPTRKVMSHSSGMLARNFRS